MKRMKTAGYLGLVLALFYVTLPANAMGGKETEGRTTEELKPVVAVSIQPQAYFVQRLAAGRLELLTLEIGRAHV